MKRAASSVVLVTIAVLIARTLPAAEFTPKLENAAPAAAEPPSQRAMSPTVANKLAVLAPKFTTPAGSKTEAIDLREIDKPRNTIIRLPTPPPETSGAKSAASASQSGDDPPRDGVIRLPSYLVREERLPKLKERDMLTPEGKIALAYQRHPGLRAGNFLRFLGLSNDGIALAMVEEELAIERRKEFYDLAGLLPGKEGKQAKALADEASAKAGFSPTR